MQNCEGTLNISQKPVLLFPTPSSQKKTNKIYPLPIGVKIKSFKIKDVDSSQSPVAKAINLETNIRLPNFVRSPASPLNMLGEQIVAKSSDNFYFRGNPTEDWVIQPMSYQTGAQRRFWWRWLLLIGSSILMLPILFQASTPASNLLEKAKIYIELNSHQVMSLPDSARNHLHSDQASSFNRAIRKARAIEPYSPHYQQAQADILRWSEVILDIAQGRANREDFAGAIAAANLIPQDEPSTKFIAQKAAESVLYWQLRAKRQNLHQNYLATAKKIINPNYASSYNQAIKILRQISPGVAEHLEAQNLIRQWSKQIYLIANHRAAQGDYQQAIKAAALVPLDSHYYQQAQNSMMKWKQFRAINHSWH
ncbi:hypothetical protein [Pleurocapsa sp. PCC 7319]|uniref:hypothetical protein n=1 Tax=Pleurocapsa sp. PCC 7319 TaxID=118161 RepID=UPI000344BB03|nr:hypothetical protein [Pleurocapsa sp. PCC 7319]